MSFAEASARKVLKQQRPVISQEESERAREMKRGKEPQTGIKIAKETKCLVGWAEERPSGKNVDLAKTEDGGGMEATPRDPKHRKHAKRPPLRKKY